MSGAVLLLYHDFASPYCRLALELARGAAEEAGLPLRLVPFQLRPSPVPLPSVDEPAFRAELESALPLAAAWGIELRPPPSVPRTGKAHEAVQHAATEGRPIEMAAAIYHALWADGRDISRVDTLVETAAAVGLEGQALHVALGLDTHREAVERAEADAEAGGVTGVPTLGLGGRVVVGLLSPDELRAWIDAR